MDPNATPEFIVHQPEPNAPLNQQFQRRPSWAPSVDCRSDFVEKSNAVKYFRRFDQMGLKPQKFETCPDWGANPVSRFADLVLRFLELASSNSRDHPSMD